MTKLILALDTSCDETSAAVTYGVRVLSNIVASQVDIHREYGGVEPAVAKRAHQRLLDPVIEEALKEARKTPLRARLRGAQSVDAIAVTIGPGLAIALEVGVAKAKELARNYQKPLITVDHMEGHLLSAFAQNSEGKFGITEPKFPAIGLLVSGGHTELVLMNNFGRYSPRFARTRFLRKYQLIGQTLDDAAGECFDKVARILGLEYPGGPIISKLAREGNPDAFDFPVPMKDSGDFNFSFSGLKTACLYQHQKSKIKDQKYKEDFAASFERVVVAHLVDKLVFACRKFKPKMILLGGGVIANRQLQKEVKREMRRLGIPVHLPYEPKLLTDNAAMIGVAGFHKARRKEFVKNINRLERVPNMSIED